MVETQSSKPQEVPAMSPYVGRRCWPGMRMTLAISSPDPLQFLLCEAAKKVLVASYTEE